MTTCGASASSDPGRHANVLVATARTADTNHRAAGQLLRTLDETLVVAPGVVAETCYLLHEFGGVRPEVAFLRSIAAGDFDLAELTVADVARMAERYADLGLGGTDASVVAIAERMNITRLATFDRRHFTVVRPAHIQAFNLLPA